MVRNLRLSLLAGLLTGLLFPLVGCTNSNSTPANSTEDTEDHSRSHAKDAEKKLYLTPGGIYTESDIKANGSMTATQKFKGLKAQHDLKPKPDDKICPITLTKANPKFSWVIDGKTYEFCCPPCVDEFVGLSKESPNEIKPPEFYRQK